MQIFVDNDILLKLASADLLESLNKIFNITNSSIFILPSAKYYFLKNKKLKLKYSQDIINRVLAALNNYTIIPDGYIDHKRFLKLSNINNIDSGEQILYSIKPPSNDYLILTGDKLSIQQLFTNVNLTDLAEEIKGKIVCLEYLFLRIMTLHNFDLLINNILASNYCGDKTIELVFRQQNLTQELAREGLMSFFNNLNQQTSNSLFNFMPA